jgi:hypothetical protein
MAECFYSRSTGNVIPSLLSNLLKVWQNVTTVTKTKNELKNAKL